MSNSPLPLGYLPNLVSNDDARRVCGNLPKSTWYHLHATGRGPRKTKIGRRSFFQVEDLKTWLDAQRGA
jgi:hypothetical protein